MNDDRDLNRLLDAWFAEGPVQAADRVIDGAASRIARQRQLPAWRLRPWRLPSMSTPIRLAAIGAALLAVLVGGVVFMGGGGSPRSSPEPTATPSPTPTSVPTATPAAISSPALMPDGPLVAGDYRLEFPDTTTTAVVTVPRGWSGYATFGTSKDGLIGGVSEIGIVAGAPTGLYPDPCHWKAGADSSKDAVRVGPTVDDLVDAILASPNMDAGESTAVTVDGYAGKQVEARMPSGLVFDQCDDGYWYPFATDAQMIRVQGQGNIWNMLVLDVDGTRLMVLDEYFDGTPAEARAEGQAVLDSIRFEP